MDVKTLKTSQLISLLNPENVIQGIYGDKIDTDEMPPPDQVVMAVNKVIAIVALEVDRRIPIPPDFATMISKGV